MKPLMRTFPPCRHTRALWALLSLAACHAPQGGSADDAPEASRVGATTDTGGGCHTVPYFEDLDGDFKGDPAKPVDPCEPGFSNEKAIGGGVGPPGFPFAVFGANDGRQTIDDGER